jgi:HprK-related kinase A
VARTQCIGDLSSKAFRKRLNSGDLRLQVGPYTYQIQSSLPVVLEGMHALYSDFQVPGEDQFADYSISIDHHGALSRLRRQVAFQLDFNQAFGAIPLSQAYAFIEWGMNWCVSIHANEYLKLHAAVIAKDAGAIVMPGVPGAGKSTLCAALALSGWRVLSDEHALIPPGSTDVVPLCRPISLKNNSIDVIRQFDGSAIFGPVSEDTHKGLVAHLKADMHALSHETTPVPVRVLVFPQYSTSEPQALRPRSRSRSFILAAYHSFNYSLLGEPGFDALVKVVDSVACYDLVYRDLDWAIETLENLYWSEAAP